MNPLIPDGYDVFGVVLTIVVMLVIAGAVVWFVKRVNRRHTSSPARGDRAEREPDRPEDNSDHTVA
jgi:hypothetical protein